MYGGEGGGYCHVSQIYERQQFEVVKGDFWLECLTIFATGCSIRADEVTDELFFFSDSVTVTYCCSLPEQLLQE